MRSKWTTCSDMSERAFGKKWQEWNLMRTFHDCQWTQRFTGDIFGVRLWSSIMRPRWFSGSRFDVTIWRFRIPSRGRLEWDGRKKKIRRCGSFSWYQTNWPLQSWCVLRGGTSSAARHGLLSDVNLQSTLTRDRGVKSNCRRREFCGGSRPPSFFGATCRVG